MYGHGLKAATGTAGIGAGAGLAYTGFPVAAAIMLGLAFVIAGLALVRLALVRRAAPAGGALPYVREPPPSPE